ncbi:MAG: nuclear transport factor 2 family protein [Lewinellaceae bacterium]|nr:nuclear transport factor 2 family protein [Lewinellaceae bacterium]
MHANARLLETFYQAFQNKDYATMQACYADTATFSDPVFQNLNAAEVRAMWEMLIRRGKDLELTFSNIQADDRQGSAEWEARYTFSATGRPVVNRIRSEFVFENGKIVRQTDRFSFYNWARQALGTPGLLLGWTGLIRGKVRGMARKNLAKFMAENGTV